jgi:excisionase family DNA binding protein
MEQTEERSIPGMLTIQEAATLSGLHETTIRNAIYRGRLSFVRMYGRMLIEQEKFETWRQSTKIGRPKKTATGGTE